MTRKTRQTKSLEQSSRRSRIGNCSRFLDAFDPNFEDRRRRWGRSAFPGSSPGQQENHIALELWMAGQHRRCLPASSLDQCDPEGNGKVLHPAEIILIAGNGAASLIGLDDDLVDQSCQSKQGIWVAMRAPVHQTRDRQFPVLRQAFAQIVQEARIAGDAPRGGIEIDLKPDDFIARLWPMLSRAVRSRRSTGWCAGD